MTVYSKALLGILVFVFGISVSVIASKAQDAQLCVPFEEMRESMSEEGYRPFWAGSIAGGNATVAVLYMGPTGQWMLHLFDGETECHIDGGPDYFLNYDLIGDGA